MGSYQMTPNGNENWLNHWQDKSIDIVREAEENEQIRRIGS